MENCEDRRSDWLAARGRRSNFEIAVDEPARPTILFQSSQEVTSELGCSVESVKQCKHDDKISKSEVFRPRDVPLPNKRRNTKLRL
jgi:hypothetical protein